MMGLKPEDLVTLPAISLELKLQLDYDPQQENPVKVELIQVESVTDKSRQSKLTINNIREFMETHTRHFLQEIVTERYFGYRLLENYRRYLILIEERSDNKIAISLDQKEIKNWEALRFIEVENEDKNTYTKYLIYVYPTPEDETNFLSVLEKHKLNTLLDTYQGIIFSNSQYQNAIEFLSEQLAYPEGLEIENHLAEVEKRLLNDEPWAERYENIIKSSIPENLINDLQRLNSISYSQENSRFSYLLTWVIPIEHCQTFLHDFIYNSGLYPPPF
jgi:hypothetical protein